MIRLKVIFGGNPATIQDMVYAANLYRSVSRAGRYSSGARSHPRRCPPAPSGGIAGR